LQTTKPVTPIQAEELAKCCEEKHSIPPQDAKHRLKIVRREWKSPPEPLRPVWDFRKDVAYCAVRIMESSQGNGVVEPAHSVVKIVTSNREVLDPDELESQGLHIDENWWEEQPTADWSPPAVGRFVEGNAEPPAPADIFRRIAENLRFYCDLPPIGHLPPERVIEGLGLWIMHTYLLPIWDATGYVFLTSALPGAGKSRVAEVIERMAFNSRLVGATTTPPEIRDLCHWGGTLIVDDVPNLKEMKDGLAVYLPGYRRSGAKVHLKQSKGNNLWRSRVVNTFSPKIFTTLKGADPALATRMFNITMVKTQDGALSRRDPSRVPPPHDFQVLRDDLYHLAFCSMSKVRGVYQAEIEAQEGRSHERWRPLFALALWIDPDGLYRRMVELAEVWELESAREQAEETGCAPILRALLRLVKEGEETVTAGDVAERCQPVPLEAGLVGRLLGGMPSVTRLPKLLDGCTQYRLNREAILAEAGRLGLVTESKAA
jgi:hypothetical protein